MLNGIWLIVLGVLAVPSLIIAKKPEAKELIDKIAPYQGWIGVVSAFWGIWGLIQSVLNLNWLSVVPVYWVTFLGVSFILFSLGLLLGVGTMKTFIKQPEAVEKLDMLITKLAPKQGMLGVAAIGLGIWGIVSSILWKVG